MPAAAQEIRTYRLDPAAFEATLQVGLRRGLRQMLLALAVGGLPVGVLLALARPGIRTWFPIMIPAFLALVAFSFVRGRQRARVASSSEWKSYQLTLGPNVLRRFVANYPAVEVLRPEVTRIFDAPGRGLTVAAGTQRFIFIPEQLLGYAGVREQLAGWRAFEPSRAQRFELARMGWMLLLMGLWLATGMIQNFWLGMLAGLGLLVGAAISIRETLRLEVLNTKQKAVGVSILGMFMLAPFARALLHFAFGMDVQWPQ